MKSTVLVVDDDQSLVTCLRRALVSAGYRVETACDGGEAYLRVKAPGCGCMLLDIAMPRFNGAELLLLMQAEDIKVPVIIMTGAGDFSGREMKQFACVVEVFRKPFSLSDLLATVSKYAEAEPVKDAGANGPTHEGSRPA